MLWNRKNENWSDEWFTEEDLKYINEPFSESDLEYIQKMNRVTIVFENYYVKK